MQAEKDDSFCQDDLFSNFLLRDYYKTLKAQNPRKRFSNLEALYRHSANHFVTNLLAPERDDFYGGIPVVSNPDVDYWINYYKTRGRHTFIKWLVRAQQFEKLMVPLLVKKGMPREFLYLSMVESGLSPSAHSAKKAAGTWQFVASTAKMYNLRINYWIDERRDPEKSTLAAADYLRDLYAQFGDWHLTMAAYNAGPGAIQKAMRLAKTDNYWTLAKTNHISRETKNYVPKILAALILGNNLKKHGFAIDFMPEEVEHPDHFVYVKRPVELSEIADLLGIKRKELSRWNPELLKGITPPKHIAGVKGYAMRIKKELEDSFRRIEDRLSYLEIKDVKIHQVRKGETLGAIARQYKITLNKIIQFNPKLNAKQLRIGKEIAIPIPNIIVKKKTQATV